MGHSVERKMRTSAVRPGPGRNECGIPAVSSNAKLRPLAGLAEEGGESSAPPQAGCSPITIPKNKPHHAARFAFLVQSATPKSMPYISTRSFQTHLKKGRPHMLYFSNC